MQEFATWCVLSEEFGGGFRSWQDLLAAHDLLARSPGLLLAASP